MGFANTLAAAGVETVGLPPRSPDLKRVRGAVREDDQGIVPGFYSILVGERWLRGAIHEFVKHYHHERNHQGVSNRLLFSAT